MASRGPEEGSMKNIITAREITIEDRVAIWDWRKDHSRFKVYLPKINVSWKMHCDWFQELLDNPEITACVAVMETLRIAALRFDHSAANRYRLSVLLKPAYCGKDLMPNLFAASAAFARETMGAGELTINQLELRSCAPRVLTAFGFKITTEGTGELLMSIGGN